MHCQSSEGALPKSSAKLHKSLPFFWLHGSLVEKILHGHQEVSVHPSVCTGIQCEVLSFHGLSQATASWNHFMGRAVLFADFFIVESCNLLCSCAWGACSSSPKITGCHWQSTHFSLETAGVSMVEVKQEENS